LAHAAVGAALAGQKGKRGIDGDADKTMYKSFFGLKENPFNVNPDPRYLFLTKQIEEALSGLMYGIQTRKGFITLTGEVGTGKTTLVNRLLDWLHLRRAKTAFLFNSRMNTNQLFDCILAEFDIACDERSKSQQLMKLNHWLLDRYRAGETAVLIIDEAQNLTFPVLEEIRLLTNLETSTDKLLQIVLSGQPELEEKLKLAQLRQLRQRITLRCKTVPLSKEQTHDYIQERLRIAGADPQGAIFPPKTIEMIHYFSMGIPRVINLLCEHALINSFVDQQKTVEARVIEDVAREFQLDELEPLAPPANTRSEAEVFQSEQFIQNLGEALSRFRMSPSVSSSTRERK
jgi:type II secretory pathway predicted ATPase ExeA